ncbi:MAG: polyphenol oxidase family protein [Myxococcota bacterium]
MILLEPQFVNEELKIIFGTREHNVEEQEEEILEYLSVLSGETGIKRFILMQQVHGIDIKEIRRIHLRHYKGISYQIEENTDAIWTEKKNLALCIKTADCMPIFVVSGSIIAAIHMGWRGARDKIFERFIRTVLFKRGIKPETINIICGPHIRECCYSVKDELINEFEMNGYNREDIFIRRGKRLFLSLESTLYMQAKNCRIPSGNIAVARLCTYCLNSLFYSYRRGESLRNISLIIKGKK